MLRVLASCNFYKSGFVALALSLCLPAISSAAWLGYKNNTQAVIVVQTSVTANGKVINGKAHTLYPGEVAWDNISAAGMRTVAVYDPKANNRLVTAENINVQNQDIFLSAQMVAQPQIPNRPPVPPALKLIAIKAPAPPGGGGQEKPKQNPNQPNQPVPPKGPLPPTVNPKTPDAPKTPPPNSPPPSDAPKSPQPKEEPKGSPPKEAPKNPSPKETPKSPPPPTESPKAKSG